MSRLGRPTPSTGADHGSFVLRSDRRRWWRTIVGLLALTVLAVTSALPGVGNAEAASGAMHRAVMSHAAGVPAAFSPTTPCEEPGAPACCLGLTCPMLCTVLAVQPPMLVVLAPSPAGYTGTPPQRSTPAKGGAIFRPPILSV